MQSKRDYAASLGLAIAGARGKFSNAAKEAIAKAEAEGMKFSDTGPTKATGPSRSASPVGDPKTAATPSAGVSDYIFPSDFRYPEGEYKAVGSDGKTYGMREVCNNCRVSLVNHMCDTPVIYGDVTVHIRGKR